MTRRTSSFNSVGRVLGDTSSSSSLAQIRKQNLLMRGILTESGLKEKSQKGIISEQKSSQEASLFKSTVNILRGKEDARQLMRAKWLRQRGGVGVIHTISDQPTGTDKSSEQFLLDAAKTNPSIIAHSERLGREILKYTNEYRRSKGLPACAWEPAVYTVCCRHSEQMAAHKKGFDHNGFSARIASLPFQPVSSGENLFKSNGIGDTESAGGIASVAHAAVDGWIHSPGHEKNLRGPYTHCAIGIAKGSDGTIYATQIFVHK